LFPRFPTYVVLIHQRQRWTDRQTDDMLSQYCPMHYSASHGCINYVKIAVSQILCTFHYVESIMRYVSRRPLALPLYDASDICSGVMYALLCKNGIGL